MFQCRAERAYPVKSAKLGKSPARGAGRTHFAGSCWESVVFPREAPRSGNGWFHPSAKRVARLGGAAGGCAPSAALRAARGRGTNPSPLFFIGRTPLRPAPGTVRNPAHAGKGLKLNAPRSVVLFAVIFYLFLLSRIFEVLLPIFSNQKLFVFAPQGPLFLTKGKEVGKGSP